MTKRARVLLGIALAALGVLIVIRTSTIHRIAEAIGYVESRGNYQAVGPATKSGARAYGKYQVMDFNIPVWSEEIIGRRLTVDQWLGDPSAQDTVARGKIGQYYGRYGNVADVASVWFSGRPLAQAQGSSDVTGTTVPDYVQRVINALA